MCLQQWYSAPEVNKWVIKKKHCVGCFYHSYDIDELIPDPLNKPAWGEHHTVKNTKAYSDARLHAKMSSDMLKLQNEINTFNQSQVQQQEVSIGEEVPLLVSKMDKFCKKWINVCTRALKRRRFNEEDDNFHDSDNESLECGVDNLGCESDESDENQI